LIGEVPKLNEKSILMLCNHSSWWDGFFTYFLNEKYFHKNYYVMMLEHKLKEFYFFNKIGAYSINQNNPKDIINSIDYSAQLLSINDNLVNIFPEGEMTYSFTNKFIGKKGVLKVIDKSGDINILLVAMKIVTLHQEYPQVFFRFNLIKKNEINNIDFLFNNLLIEIDENILKNNYSIIFNGKKSKGN
jgi:1-acyl-sn-glycerol-3-phosphate acyltransferase